jgi:hypothetical protein
LQDLLRVRCGGERNPNGDADVGNVLRRDDRHHAFARERRLRAHAGELGSRQRAADDARIELAGPVDVGDEAPATGEEGTIASPTDARAD